MKHGNVLGSFGTLGFMFRMGEMERIPGRKAARGWGERYNWVNWLDAVEVRKMIFFGL